MTSEIVGLASFPIAVLLILVGVPIAVSLGSVATLGMLIVYSWRPFFGFRPDLGIDSTLSMLTTVPYEFLNSYSLAALPLFILVGQIAYQARFTTDIYETARVMLARVPGGLALATLVGCGGFSAVSGSSLACASAMGKFAVPEMLRSNYHPGLACGTVAIGGTLGAMIPPSILFIVYGYFTEQSVAQLFAAGTIPGLMTLAVYMIVVVLWAKLQPSAAPRLSGELVQGRNGAALVKSAPILILFIIMIGGIYAGVFTPSEAGGVGAVLISVMAAVSRRLSRADFAACLKDTAVQTATIFAIAISGKLFVNFISATGMSDIIVDTITNSGLSVFWMMFMIVVLYLLLGMVLDPLGIVLLTLPIIVPIVEALGFDLIWFGVILVKMLEIGLVTPPIGLNVFVLYSSIGGSVSMGTIFRGVAYFLLAEVFIVSALFYWPDISLWLPSVLL